MKRASLLLVLVLLTLAGEARAFLAILNGSGQMLRWDLSGQNPAVSTNSLNPQTHAIRYFLAADGYSATNTAAELNALRASFGIWQSVPGTALKFEDAGTLPPGVDINPFDNTNVVYWAKTSTLVNGGHDSISGALAVTFPSYDPANNLIQGADIVINGKDFAWFTDAKDTTATTSYYIESTVIHEIGHLFGLDHSPAGSAIMLAHGDAGPRLADNGLSDDDIAAVRFLYPATNSLATLRGVVTNNAGGVLGAIVIAEDAAGNVLSATLSRPGGAYELPLLPPGNYQVHAAPLDANGSSAQHLSAPMDFDMVFAGALVNFLPTTNKSVTLTGGATNFLNFNVVGATPAFRIASIQPSAGTAANVFPAAIKVGGSETVGVLSPNFPVDGSAILTVTGDGLAIGPTILDLFSFSGAGLRLLKATITVATNATPGMRTLLVRSGTNLAHAHGYLTIQPAKIDRNFDGVDDAFQRRYFPLFTAPQAGPNADPDGDGFNNLAESIAGTIPTNAASLLRIESVTQTVAGTTVAWQSVNGKKYQLESRPQFGGATWQAVGTPVSASGSMAQFFDAGATNGMKFYRVQVLP